MELILMVVLLVVVAVASVTHGYDSRDGGPATGRIA
jgi:hypothetical protein